VEITDDSKKEKQQQIHWHKQRDGALWREEIGVKRETHTTTTVKNMSKFNNTHTKANSNVRSTTQTKLDAMNAPPTELITGKNRHERRILAKLINRHIRHKLI
jgi:ERCC4-type nuclease